MGQADRRPGGPGAAEPVGEGAAGPAPPPRTSAAEGAVRGGGRAAGPAPCTPRVRLMTLAETGTRGLLGATLGSSPGDRDEPTLARRLLRLLEPGMLVLLDRAFDANPFLTEVAG